MTRINAAGISAARAARSRAAAAPVALAVMVAVAVTLACAGCGSTASLTAGTAGVPGLAVGTATVPGAAGTTTASATVTGPTLVTPASTRATVTAGRAAPVAPTSRTQGFLGIASELSTITTLSGSPTDLDTPFVNLLRNLSPGAPFLLRLGGHSADSSWWAVPGMKTPLGVNYTMTPQWGADVKALLSAVGARALLGVSLELDSRRVAAYEVHQYEKYIGARLIDAMELGNEPELYAAFPFYRLADGTRVDGRVKGDYTIADYGRDFTRIASGLGGAPLAGPSSGSPTWLPELGTMLHYLPARLKVVTVHAYPLKRCSASTHLSVSDFFTTASIQGLADLVHAMVRAAGAHGKPLRVDEINGISCGGEPGVSNTLAEALWALNVLPALWRAGVQGVNFQTIDGDLNQMITATHSSASGWRVLVQPEYYALLAFADVAPAGAHLLNLRSGPAVPHLYQYAVRDPDGSDRVVLTNIGAGERTVGVSLPGARGAGLVSLLTGPSLTATGNTTLGGESLDPHTGELTGVPAGTLVKANRRGVYAVRVPAHSAAILTVGA